MMSARRNEEELALKKFRRAVSDVIKPCDPDEYIFQWLKARDFNHIRAEKMLRESMEWRKEVGADCILDTFTIPEVLQKYYTIGFLGHDKEGCPLWMVPLGKLDIKGLVASITNEEFAQYIIYMIETSKKDMKEQSSRLGKFIGQHVWLFDMEGLTLENAFCRQALDNFIFCGKMHDVNYPETMKQTIVVNVPNYFYLAYNIIKPILSENTKSKIQMFDSDRSKWLPAILEYVDEDKLPKHWGGTMVDEHGDPKCSSKICMGGEIPKRYYMKHQKYFSDNSNMKSATIRNRDSLKVQLDVVQDNSKIRWAFQTESYDIGFSIHRQDNSLEDIVPYSRVDKHDVSIVEGETKPLPTGQYVVTFDNSYSIMRSKLLFYSVSVCN